MPGLGCRGCLGAGMHGSCRKKGNVFMFKKRKARNRKGRNCLSSWQESSSDAFCCISPILIHVRREETVAAGRRFKRRKVRNRKGRNCLSSWQEICRSKVQPRSVSLDSSQDPKHHCESPSLLLSQLLPTWRRWGKIQWSWSPQFQPVLYLLGWGPIMSVKQPCWASARPLQGAGTPKNIRANCLIPGIIDICFSTMLLEDLVLGDHMKSLLRVQS
nr:uncharacterized protein LOC105477847 isoform X1 [Macaca nemestrina]